MRWRQGNIIIPAFALGRTQELLHLLLDLCRQGRLPRLQVCVDSPMAHKVHWLRPFESPLRHSYVVHGEAPTACGFADLIADRLGWSVEAPAPGTRVDL